MVTVTIRDQWSDGARLHVVGSLKLSGTYPPDGGPLGFQNTNLQASRPPVALTVSSRSSGAVATYTPGPQRDLGRLRVFWYGPQLPGAQPYPPGITDDEFDFVAVFATL